jgi:energy-coupling factor transporter ATP-binding protein EcfA2
MGDYTITQIKIENLRGYFSTSLSLARDRTIIVGPNNSGKTSFLKILSWVINDLEFKTHMEKRLLTDEEKQFLLPARSTRHRARRLTLTVKVHDGRSHNKYKCDNNGNAKLRVNIRLTPEPMMYLGLGRPKRGEQPEHSNNAISLLRRVQKEYSFIHVPSFRDVRTDRFDNTLVGLFKSKIEERALHSDAAGAPVEYRQVSESLNGLKEVILGLTQPMWGDLKERLPAGMVEDASMELDVDQGSLLEFLESKLAIKISTGNHDSQKVPLTELGSGLQSLLDLSINEAEIAPHKHTILAVEEPEAFLHPAAQRTVALRLMNSNIDHQTIITTHSPIIVEEARFSEVILCREQKFYEPRSKSIERDEINTSYLTRYGAEMAFADAVLLVEGPGDHHFFEGIRRRLARFDSSGIIDRCYVVPVGGSNNVAPWIRLIQAYGPVNERPIDALAVFDADVVQDVRECFKIIGRSFSQEVSDALSEITFAKNDSDFERWREGIATVNSLAEEEDSSFHLLSIDLEEGILGNACEKTCRALADKLNWDDKPSRSTCLSRLGAKAFSPSERPKKDPWIRDWIAQSISPEELPANTKDCLRRWFNIAMEEDYVENLLREWQESCS